MKLFDQVAPVYDAVIGGDRFSHAEAAALILPFASGCIGSIADLAAGTGDMAGAVHRLWPDANILCEEPSLGMLELLRQKYPTFETHLCSLQDTQIVEQDLVTIAFNSINYVPPLELPGVIARIRAGMHDGRIFYFDAMTIESAVALLKGREMLTKVQEAGPLTITKSLTISTLTHEMALAGGATEHHVQYFVAEADYRSLLEENHFKVEHFTSTEGSLRSTFICKSV